MANLSVNDYSKRQNAYSGMGNYSQAAAVYGSYGHTPGSQASALRAAQYLPPTNSMMQSEHVDPAGIAALAQGFGAMGLHPSLFAAGGRTSSQVPAPNQAFGAPMAQYPSNPQQLLYNYPGASLVSGMSGINNGNQASNSMYTPMGQHGYYSIDNSPHGQTWTPRATSDGSTHVMPTLITPRRDSTSSNEDHLPTTPYTYGAYQNGVAVYDRSPNALFTHSGTPSPSQFGYMTPQYTKQPSVGQLPLHLQILLQQDPPVPRAIPAPNSPMKPLDRCLENKNGETNVYIRGLLPETTDDMLHNWGTRFGDIQSSKSIIDLKTGSCKGFGFIKYHNFEDAENCIRAFHWLGYEVSFARESFYAKLKKFSDEANTNLYVSNIPRNMNEHELSVQFLPFKVCSARILRDDSGNGRGVGFARFESRDVCEDVIKQFNNSAVTKPGGEEHIIQIRYSDTHEQKMLKQQTAAARQFRAAEFEFGCMQAGRSSLSIPSRGPTVSPPGSTSGPPAVLTGSPTGAGSQQELKQYLVRNDAKLPPFGYVPPAASAPYYVSRPALSTINSDMGSGAQTPRVNLPSTDGGVPLDNEVDAKAPVTPTESVHASEDNEAGQDVE
ncbi:putative transporter [Venturia nashicola]|uniref:Putative transporter n=1 Tax=Venturia nashicola TaxID=86259 RepID=A0A4Z1P957_9PEZI|nr:putative transporter [Venturia nashicola]